MSVVRAALVQTGWTGDKESMIQVHEDYARQAAAYAEQGDCEQAAPAAQRALELDPEEPMAKAAAERCPASE